jgi:hypothetical protein
MPSAQTPREHIQGEGGPGRAGEGSRQGWRGAQVGLEGGPSRAGEGFR